MKRAVSFDLGGTLLKMRRDRMFRRVLADEGYAISPEKIHSAYADVESSWLRRYGYRRLSPEKSMESYRRLDGFAFRRMFPDAASSEGRRVSGLLREKWPDLEKRFPPRLYPDAEPTLRSLRRNGFLLALVSNAPPDTMEVVEKLGLGKYMACFVISGNVGVSKPNPEIFKIALGRLGVLPGEALHVGDVYEADVVGAVNAGMTGVLIDRGGSPSRLGCPTVRHLGEVLRLLSSDSPAKVKVSAATGSAVGQAGREARD